MAAIPPTQANQSENQPYPSSTDPIPKKAFSSQSCRIYCCCWFYEAAYVKAGSLSLLLPTHILETCAIGSFSIIWAESKLILPRSSGGIGPCIQSIAALLVPRSAFSNPTRLELLMPQRERSVCARRMWLRARFWLGREDCGRFERKW